MYKLTKLRVTYTGLEFKEQWSTIISGRKSSLKEAMVAKSVIFFFCNEAKLTDQIRSDGGGILQTVHLLLIPW